MGGGVLDKAAWESEFFLLRFFRTELPFFVLLRSRDIKGKSQLPVAKSSGLAERKNQQKKFDISVPLHPAQSKLLITEIQII